MYVVWRPVDAGWRGGGRTGPVRRGCGSGVFVGRGDVGGERSDDERDGGMEGAGVGSKGDDDTEGEVTGEGAGTTSG